MKWLNDYKMRLVVVGFVAAVVLSSGTAKADFTFGEPTNLGPTVNTASGETGPFISADGLSLYFASNRPGTFGRGDIWVTRRQSVNDPWEEAVNLGPTVNTEHRDQAPEISSDGLELYFQSDRPDGYGALDIWVVTRESEDDYWGDPVNLGSLVNSPADEGSPSISANGLELYFAGWRPEFARPGSSWSDIWVTTRPTKDDPWGEPVNLGPVVNSSTQDARPSIFSDGLVLFFDSQRHGRVGDGDLYMTMRESLSEPWGTPKHLGPLINTFSFDENATISADGSTLFFDSRRDDGLGKYDIWQSPVFPVVDLNNDGIVDVDDMCIMVDNWGTDDPLCDIGPMPWGDGIVDVQDLIVLAEHLFEEFPPVEPVE